MLCNAQLIEYSSSACPTLVRIKSITNTFSKAVYVVYYKLQESDTFRNVSDMKEIFLVHRQLVFKIIDHEHEGNTFILSSNDYEINGMQVTLTAKNQQGQITLKGELLNRNEANSSVMDISLLRMSHYEDFFRFRKKYRALEHLTAKVQFKLDHRIKVVQSSSQHVDYFSFDQRQTEHYFIYPQHSNTTLKFQLEQIISVEGLMTVESICECEIDVTAIFQGNTSYIYSITYGMTLKLEFLLQIVKNQNAGARKLVAIRILQTSEGGRVKIGNKSTIHLSSCLTVTPLDGTRYYDIQFKNLSENFEQLFHEEPQLSLYSYLSKLTPAFPKYSNLFNQKLIDLTGCKKLLLGIGNVPILSIPLIYIIRGFNVFHSVGAWAKFYIEFQDFIDKGQFIEQDRRRLYEMSVIDLWNFSEVIPYLEDRSAQSFELKIINQQLPYYIPFQFSQASRSQFPAQSKTLDLRNEFIQRNMNKLLLASKHKGDLSKLNVLKTQSINQFYVIKMESSSAIYFQITIGNEIVLEGALQKSTIINNRGNVIRHALNSADGQFRVVVCLSFTPIDQLNDSLNSFYKLRHGLFSSDQSSDEVIYDVQIRKQSQRSKPKDLLRSRITPSTASPSLALRQLASSSGFLVKEKQLILQLKIRRSTFNEQLSVFSSQQLLSKKILINTLQIVVNDSARLLHIDGECYGGVEIDFYDPNEKKLLKYYLQVYCMKSIFLDCEDSSYVLKVPTYLWTINNLAKQDGEKCASSYTITTHLSRRRDNQSQAMLSINYIKELVLDHFNYNDGISVCCEGAIAYNKMMEVMRVRCDIVQGKIGWVSQSQWYLGVLTFENYNFYVLIKRKFDPYEQKKVRESSVDSAKTVSKQIQSNNGKQGDSTGKKGNKLAKTMGNMDLFKLKKKKNELVAEGRQLTARYVQKEQRILLLANKIEQANEAIKHRNVFEADTGAVRKGNKKESAKMREFYRSICECGSKKPKYNGYCQECLTKLRKRYEAYHKEYLQKSYQYEGVMFAKFNQKEKLNQLKTQLQRHLNGPMQSNDELDSQINMNKLMAELQDKDLKRSIEELKMELFDLEESRKSLAETSSWQQEQLESKIRQQDEILYKYTLELQGLRTKRLQLQQLTFSQSNQL